MVPSFRGLLVTEVEGNLSRWCATCRSTNLPSKRMVDRGICRCHYVQVIMTMVVLTNLFSWSFSVCYLRRKSLRINKLVRQTILDSYL